MRYNKVLLRYLHWKQCCMLIFFLISAQVCGYARKRSLLRSNSLEHRRKVDRAIKNIDYIINGKSDKDHGETAILQKHI